MINIKSYDEKVEKLFTVTGLKNKTVILWCEEHKEIKNLTLTSKDSIEYLDNEKTKAYEIKKLFIGYKTKSGINSLDITKDVKEYLKNNFDL